MFTSDAIKPEKPLNVPGMKMLLRSQRLLFQLERPRQSRPVPPTVQKVTRSPKLLFEPHKVSQLRYWRKRRSSGDR